MFSISRRAAFIALGALMIGQVSLTPASADDLKITRDMILNDPDTPVGGNPVGDVTIVAFTDYNCPYCKKSAPDLARIVHDDGKIRLVYREWPILAPTSTVGARLALGARYQGKYEIAHRALMEIHGHGISEDAMRAALQADSIDMDQLNKDLAGHAAEIDAMIKRNLAIGDAMSFQGTPVYLVGPYVASTLDYAGFKRIVADARTAQASK